MADSSILQEPPVALKKPRIGGLDGLRGISIALVIFSHLTLDPDSNRPVSIFCFNLGTLGVSVFFVISGLLITSLLLDEQERTGRIDLRKFYVRRSFRILPAAMVFLAVIGILILLKISSDTPWGILASLAFFRNLTGKDISDTSHFWSLSIEEQYYLLWPLVFALVSKRRRVLVVFALIALMPIWRHANARIWGAASIHDRRLDLLGDQILTGCLLALLRNQARFRPMFSRKAVTSRFTAAVVATVLLTSLFPRAIQILRAFLPILQNTCVFLLVNFAVEDSTSRPNNFLNRPWLVWIGFLSYSLYLWQQPFCLSSGSFHLPLPFNVLGALGVAVASYYLVEKPALRARARFLHG